MVNDTNINPDLTDDEGVRIYPRKARRKAKNIYGDQLIALSALLFMAVWRSGWRAFALVLVSVLASIAVDIICCALSKKKYNPRDLSTVTAGMCISLMMPASVTYPVIICGAALAMGVKHIFGGKDNYIFNPTAVALAFLIICYPANMLLFPKLNVHLPIFGEAGAELTSGIESYLMKLGSAEQLTPLNMLLGDFQGPLGTTHILVILICAACLLFRRALSTTLTLSALGTIVIFEVLFPLYDNISYMFALELIGGYLLFGLLFLANDPQTTPKTQLGRLYSGLILGLSVIFFRYFGKVEGSFVFALLVSNALAVRMDRAAEKTLSAIYRFSTYMKTRLSYYEKFSEEAKKGETKSLSDTQEIYIDPINYDMPPIDNKVIKINRKKPNLLSRTQEKFGTIGEKGKTVKPPETKSLPSHPKFTEEVKKSIIKIKGYFEKEKKPENGTLRGPAPPRGDSALKSLLEQINSVDEDGIKKEQRITDGETENPGIRNTETDSNPENEQDTDTDIDISDFDEIAGMPGTDTFRENASDNAEVIENNENKDNTEK